ncbi:MAG: glycosyltransferase [Parvibaculum sedimenti]|uniref:glycosyltransferase family 32 protein n=1 Tax=Parvibaculum sedimenti TaxID=2608632 RepID=UPI003BB799CF
MILASILITANDAANRTLPEPIRANIASFRKHHPEFAHSLFNTEIARELLSSRFGREVLSAFDSLKPYAFKADLARYCILHEHGGIYADLSFFFVDPLPFDGKRLLVFPGLMATTPWDVSNGIIAAPPGHKALARAIELVCANVRKNYYGPTSFCPTGPTLFGKAVALTCEPEDILTGRALWMDSPAPGEPKVHCKAVDGKLVAVKRKTKAGTISELGVSTGNNYLHHWRAKDVYASGV